MSLMAQCANVRSKKCSIHGAEVVVLNPSQVELGACSPSNSDMNKNTALWATYSVKQGADVFVTCVFETEPENQIIELSEFQKNKTIFSKHLSVTGIIVSLKTFVQVAIHGA